MRIKGKTAFAGLAVAGLLATAGIGTALAEQGSTEDSEDHLVVSTKENPTKESLPFPKASGEHTAVEGPDEAPQGMASPTGFPVFVDLETITNVLELKEEELHSQITDGKSLAEIAGKEKTRELIDAIVDANEERIESERDAGRLSDEEAADAGKDLRRQVTELVNSEGPKNPPSVRSVDGSNSDDEPADRTA